MENVNLLQVNVLKDVLDFHCLNCSNMNHSCGIYKIPCEDIDKNIAR